MTEVGPILRRARESRGLSQRALARLSGVSNATISLIEKGDTDPSVGLLKKILEGLSISISEFFSSGFDTKTHYFFTPAQFIEIGSGPISFRQIAPDLGGRSLQIMHERYEPGADTGPSLLTHEGEEGGLVIKGHVEIQVADQTRVLGPGDAYQFPSTLPHRFRNVGDEPGELISRVHAADILVRFDFSRVELIAQEINQELRLFSQSKLPISNPSNYAN